MVLRVTKLAPIAFWLAFLALGFVTSFPGSVKAPVKSAVVAETETTAGKSARD